ncbi:hypothetical protein [Vibrio injensis]|uniref:hypothetical protein n=1 Tax=Vibrio injensis TaxID=1307414 RepID=UPI0009323873|nr:hypothetical protein [Vibrio injensis]
MIQRYKYFIVLLVIFLFGCNSSVQQLSQDWESVYNHCTDLELGNEADFVTTSWFDELDLETQKQVALYVYQTNFYACHSQKTVDFRSQLEKLGAKEKLKYYQGIGVFDTPNTSLVQGVDKDVLNKLIEAQPQNLNLRHIGIQLGFRN